MVPCISWHAGPFRTPGKRPLGASSDAGQAGAPTDVELVNVAHALGHFLRRAQQGALQGRAAVSVQRAGACSLLAGTAEAAMQMLGLRGEPAPAPAPRPHPVRPHVGGLEGPLCAGPEGFALERLVQRACGASSGHSGPSSIGSLDQQGVRARATVLHCTRLPAPRSSPKSQYSMTTTISASCPDSCSSSSWNTSLTPPPAGGWVWVGGVGRTQVHGATGQPCTCKGKAGWDAQMLKRDLAGRLAGLS